MAFSSLTAWGQEAPPDWTVDNFRWTGPLAPAAAVEVINPYGDVRLRGADAGEVEVSAMIQRRTSDPVRAEVKLGRRRGRLRIEVVYPVAPRGDLRRVDLAVFVPAGARLAVHTRDGMIQARGLANDVELESAGGDVFVSTTRSARVSTRRGNITLRLPEGADARVRIRAPAGRKTVTLGRGTQSLSLTTRRGGVTLLAPAP